MIDNIANRNKLRKNITIANTINSIFTGLLCLMEISIGIGIVCCQSTVASLMNGVQNADAESYIDGYMVIGSLLGAGATAIITGLLYLLLIVSTIYLVAFLTENIIGHRIAFKLKKESYAKVSIKKLKRNAIFKCVLALLIILPGGYFVFSMQWFGLLVIIVPQVFVMVLALQIIRMLPNVEESPESTLTIDEIDEVL